MNKKISLSKDKSCNDLRKLIVFENSTSSKIKIVFTNNKKNQKHSGYLGTINIPQQLAPKTRYTTTTDLKMLTNDNITKTNPSERPLIKSS